MKRLCYSLVWLVVAVLLAAFLTGVSAFALSLAQVDLSRSGLFSVLRLVVPAVLFVGTLVLCVRGLLPGTGARGSG
jgi:hypothetical protein